MTRHRWHVLCPSSCAGRQPISASRDIHVRLMGLRDLLALMAIANGVSILANIH